MSSVHAFISVFEEFLDDLERVLPKNKKIKVYKQKFKTMKKANPRKIMDIFMETTKAYTKVISERDETYIMEGNNAILEEMKVKEWWNDVSDNSKNSIWQYLNTLVVLGTTISTIPQNLLSTIESVAEQCAEQLGGSGDTNAMSPENMGNLLAGMQSMLGNMMPPSGMAPKSTKEIVKKESKSTKEIVKKEPKSTKEIVEKEPKSTKEIVKKEPKSTKEMVEKE